MTTPLPTFSTFLTETTGHEVADEKPIKAALPQYLEALYRPYKITVNGQELCEVRAQAADLPPPGSLVKQLHRLADKLGFPPEQCCLVSENLDTYSRKRLVELKQPFCLPGRQLYWPVVGYMQTRTRSLARTAGSNGPLSPAAQQVLLAALLQRVQFPSAVTALAEPLGMSPISASRAAGDLVSAGLFKATEEWRHRWVDLSQERAAVWQAAQTRLRNPIMKIIRIRKNLRPEQARLLAGETALAEQTKLAETGIPTYAMAHKSWREAGKGIEIIPHDDDGLCRIELWRYEPLHLTDGPCVDPLSLALSLRDNEDERVSQSLKELMESLPWHAA